VQPGIRLPTGQSTMLFAQADFCVVDLKNILRRGFTESTVLRLNSGDVRTNLGRVIALSPKRIGCLYSTSTGTFPVQDTLA
jgi:hypothetical protein